MSARVGRAPGGTRDPAQAGRAGPLARRRSADTAGRPARRASEEHHEHETTCPMSSNRKPAGGPSDGRGSGRVKNARSPAPQSGSGTRRVASAHAKSSPARDTPSGAKQPVKRANTANNRPEWNTSPPARPRRTSTGNSSKPVTGDKSPSRRNPPTKKPVDSKPAPARKSGIPKRLSAGSSAADSNKQGSAKVPKNARKGSTSVEPEKVRPDTASEPAEKRTENGTDNHRDRLSVPDDRPRSGSITGAGQGELGKFLEKLHYEEIYGSSDGEHNKANATEPARFKHVWRTGDGDSEAMNALRTKPRPKEAPISPNWKFEDIVIARKPEREEKEDKSERKNRFSFLIDSTDDEEPGTYEKSAEKDFSRFDDFLRDSLSPDQNKTNGSVSREKPKPAPERIVRPSTAARVGSAPSQDPRSRSRSKDRDPRKGTGRGGKPSTTSYLDDLIQPKSPEREVSPPSPRRGRKSTTPQAERSVKSSETRSTAPSRQNARGGQSSRRSPRNSRTGRSSSRTPSPEKSKDFGRRSPANGNKRPQKQSSAPGRGEPPRDRQDLRSEHERRSLTPSPDAREVFERYHDVYPDDKDAAARSPSSERWSAHKREVQKDSHNERSPSPAEMRRDSRYSYKEHSPSPRDYRTPKTSSQKERASSLFSDTPKSDYYNPQTAVQLRERRDERDGEKKVKRKSLSLAGMSNPERNTADDEGDRLRRLIMSTEALERRLFAP